MTEEHKKKISESHFGKSSGMLGKNHSEKTIRKLILRIKKFKKILKILKSGYMTGCILDS